MESNSFHAHTRRLKWQFKSMEEVHTAANNLMKYILINERSKRWRKVVEAYERLLWLIDRKHFPPEYEPPASYSSLLYECHFHIGLALQRLNRHKGAVAHYTQAIQAVSSPKGGCQAGCIANSCMLTPLFARRAFAHCLTGDLGQAQRDVEDLTVLDMKNPDVYCVRALVRNTKKEEKQALQDLDYGLNLNPKHSGCNIVRRAIANPPTLVSGPEVQSINNVDSFLHPFAMDFYDRMLYTLLVPHKVTTVSLTPDKPSWKQMEFEIRRSISANSSRNSSCGDPFRCGTVAPRDNVLAAKRRKDYGEAVRKHVSTPQTGEEFMERLQREIKRRQYTKTPFCDSQSAVKNWPRSTVGFIHKRSSRDAARMTSAETTQSSCYVKFTYQTPATYTIPVFQPVNIKNLVRMYYRPWQGDRLPTADVPHPKLSPAFY